jgi:hypothetical protein
MLDQGSLALQKIESNEILSCSLWIEKNIKYIENPLYEDNNGEVWIHAYYKKQRIVGHICEKGEL